MTSPAPFSCAAASHTGLVRTLNEDAFIARPELGLWAVADGMGGHAAGDLASRTVVDALAAIAAPAGAVALAASVRDAIQHANTALLDEARRRGPGTVVGATVVVLMISGGHFACLWAGDSRLYLFRNGTLMQITRDHSQVQAMVEAGALPAAAAEHHPLANVITRAVGAALEVQLEGMTGAVAAGDVFLLCTDGLSKLVAGPDIASILERTALQDQPATLIAAALGQGGGDNVTVVVIGVAGGSVVPA